jgi:hypothetical protein
VAGSKSIFDGDKDNDLKPVGGLRGINNGSDPKDLALDRVFIYAAV